jgi:Domain of unknown function (DUF6933)
VILRCTQKLLTVIGRRAVSPAPAPDGEDWYANLIWLSGRKCLLLTHSATLFTALHADVTAAALRSTHRLVTEVITRELAAEDLPADTFGDLPTQDLLLARTADRSVLGCMNDMAYLCQHIVAHAGSLAATDLADLNRTLRRNINSARGYQQPIELTSQRVHRPAERGEA